MFDDANHIPLVACWPYGSVHPGRRVADFINFIDLAPAFLELFGVDGQAAGMSPITGRSFTDLLHDKPATQRPFVILGASETMCWPVLAARMDLAIPCEPFGKAVFFTSGILNPTAGRVEIPIWDEGYRRQSCEKSDRRIGRQQPILAARIWQTSG